MGNVIHFYFPIFIQRFIDIYKDEDKTNNCVDNLEWCTNLYNTNYGEKHKQKLSENAKRYWERKRAEE